MRPDRIRRHSPHAASALALPAGFAGAQTYSWTAGNGWCADFGCFRTKFVQGCP